jgi:hypothetical protein
LFVCLFVCLCKSAYWWCACVELVI